MFSVHQSNHLRVGTWLMYRILGGNDLALHRARKGFAQSMIGQTADSCVLPMYLSRWIMLATWDCNILYGAKQQCSQMFGHMVMDSLLCQQLKISCWIKFPLNTCCEKVKHEFEPLFFTFTTASTLWVQGVLLGGKRHGTNHSGHRCHV